MPDHSSAVEEKDWKYPLPSAPNDAGWLKIDSELEDRPHHEIYWHEYGNLTGIPVLFLHGGPGGGTEPKHARFFDPAHYRIVLFDQRGCGQSKPKAASNPKAALCRNTTAHLINDIEALRHGLNIETMHLFGGSWGSTLAMAYAIKHPSSVRALILRGIFLCRKPDLDYFYQGNAAHYNENERMQSPQVPGAYLFYPDAWRQFVSIVEPEKRRNMIEAYGEIFTNPNADPQFDPTETPNALPTEEQREALERAKQAAVAWSTWEGASSFLVPGTNLKRFSDVRFALEFARIENHYFRNFGFLNEPGQDNYLLDNVSKIGKIPVSIVQGHFDQVCPRYQADQLVEALSRNGSKVQYIVTAAGHSATERANVRALTEIMDNLR